MLFKPNLSGDGNNSETAKTVNPSVMASENQTGMQLWLLLYWLQTEDIKLVSLKGPRKQTKQRQTSD